MSSRRQMCSRKARALLTPASRARASANHVCARAARPQTHRSPPLRGAVRATIVSMGGAFDLAAALRRIRRSADMSQRELSAVTGLAVSTLGHAEAGTRDLPVGGLIRAAAVAGLRLVLVDDTGQEVAGMSADAVRDMGGRRFPAHLDTRYSDDGGGTVRTDTTASRPGTPSTGTARCGTATGSGPASPKITSSPSPETPRAIEPMYGSASTGGVGPRSANEPFSPGS